MRRGQRRRAAQRVVAVNVLTRGTGRVLTLEDAVIFFDVVLGTGLDAQERGDLVAFLRAL